MESLGTVGTQIVNTFTGAISGTVSAVSQAVVDMFNGIFVSGDGLSSLAIWGLVFAGVGLVIGLSKRFTSKIG